jgi:hypothetical protein
MVIPTALLIAMVVLMTATALLSQSRQTLQFSGMKAQQSRRLFLAQGAVNEFIDRLNGDTGFLGYSAGSPFTGTWQDITYEAWTEPDPADPLLRRVVGRAFPTDQPSAAARCEIVVQAGEDLAPKVVTNVPDENITSPDPIFLSDVGTGSWTTLPNLPRRGRATEAGGEVAGSGDAGTLIFGGGNNAGRLFFVYAPGIDGGLTGHWADIDPNPLHPARQIGVAALEFMVGVSAGGSHGFYSGSPNTLAGLTCAAQFVVEEAQFPDYGSVYFPNAALWLSKNAAVFEYDSAAGSWDMLPAMENHELVSGSFVPKPGKWEDGSDAGACHINGIVGPMACDDRFLYAPLYKKGADLVARFDLAASVWNVLPPIPDRAGAPTDVTYVATSGHDVYVIASPYQSGGGPTGGFTREAPRILRLNSAATGWDALAQEVPASQVRDGVLSEAPGPASKLGCMAAGRDGALYVCSRQSQPNTIFKYAGGRWTPLAGPRSSDSSFAEAPQADIGVDGTGAVLLRSPNESGADEMYVIRPSNYRPLPPLPDGVAYSAQMIGGGSTLSSQTIYRPKSGF